MRVPPAYVSDSDDDSELLGDDALFYAGGGDEGGSRSDNGNSLGGDDAIESDARSQSPSSSLSSRSSAYSGSSSGSASPAQPPKPVHIKKLKNWTQSSSSSSSSSSDSDDVNSVASASSGGTQQLLQLRRRVSRMFLFGGAIKLGMGIMGVLVLSDGLASNQKIDAFVVNFTESSNQTGEDTIDEVRNGGRNPCGNFIVVDPAEWAILLGLSAVLSLFHYIIKALQCYQQLLALKADPQSLQILVAVTRAAKSWFIFWCVLFPLHMVVYGVTRNNEDFEGDAEDSPCEPARTAIWMPGFLIFGVAVLHFALVNQGKRCGLGGKVI